MLYDAAVPSAEALSEALSRGTRPFVLAKRGSDAHFSRALLVKAEPSRTLPSVVPGLAPLTTREALTVRWLDRKEEVVARDRMRLYRPCYARVRGEMDAGSVQGVLTRNANGQVGVLCVLCSSSPLSCVCYSVLTLMFSADHTHTCSHRRRR